ncbi:hypothetical protein H3H37_08710 [Duganella sp. LX20W]|uniref:O-antigen ligase n=1 Tax=Rugamonas brunnea TaxID=2758569 RepID=A0A7W2ER51_9BURK|nr:hypothetical protein [Rugamonas brunnea]MBA5637135.1 hypothetical protein [Rugamonas brunnea]
MFARFKRKTRAAEGYFERTRAPRAITWVLLAAMMLLALLLGAVIGLSSPVLLTILGGSIFVLLFFILLDSYQMLQAMLVLTFVIQGMAVYFLRNRQAPWVVVGLAVIFLMRAMMDMTFSRRDQAKPVIGRADSGALVALLLFVVCFFVSALLNRAKLAQLVVAIKSTLPMFGVLLALAWMYWQPQRLQRIWTIMVGVMLVQLPVVFYQHFFVSTRRTQASHDAVVGTFGGNPDGGGNSAIMVMFVIGIMAYAMARWDKGLMGRKMMAFICAIGLAIILLGEVKAAFIWLPLASCFVLRQRVMKNVMSFVVYSILGAALCTTIYLTYDALYWGKLIDKHKGVSAKLEAGGGYFFDPRSVNYETGEVGRGASLAIWAGDRLASIPTRLIGYGPGAIKSSSGLGMGPLYKRFAPLHVDVTTMAVLLWDVGLIGTFAYLAILLFGLRAGWRLLVSGRGDPAQQAMLEASVASLIMFLSLTIYNRTLMDDPGAELFFVLCLGCVIQLSRYSPAAVAAPARTAPVAGRPALRGARPAVVRLARPVHG